jgi:hypothetical protein
MLGTKCLDIEPNRTHWLYPRGKGGCHHIEELVEDLHADQIVFTFQIPFVKENVVLDFSRWQQNLIGILQLEIHFAKESPVGKGFFSRHN